MPRFHHRLFIIATLLFLGDTGFAQEKPESKEKPLPKREVAIPKIEGYGDWTFTDSIGTLRDDDRLIFIKAGEDKCEFGKEEQRDRSKWPDCFYGTVEIFEEPAEIFILVVKKGIERILIHFNRLESKSASKDCASVLNVVVDHLIKKFGVPTSKNDEKKQVFWESPYGGKIEFRNNCISEGRGMVLFNILPTPPASEQSKPEP